MIVDERVETGPAASVSKRCFDVVLALAVIVFSSPLLLVIAAAVAATSRGPVLFRQRRTGLNGAEFIILKFRTMSVAEDGDTVVQATRNDQRVTSIGRFLRKASLDELPQLFNVVAGDMSLVGPRPHALAHDRAFEAAVPLYSQRFRARPGITGLAQVNGHRGELRTVEEVEGRIQLDIAYIENWSLWRDIKILALTCIVAGFHKTAY